MIRRFIIVFGMMLVISAMSMQWASAACPLCKPDYEEYPHEGFLKSLGPEEEKTSAPVVSAKTERLKNPLFNKSLQTSETNSDAASNQATESAPVRSSSMLVPVTGVARSDVVLDVSNGASEYIDGAVHINYMEFYNENKELKSVDEIAALLGNAGISPSDRVVLTGTDYNCPTCLGGPFGATFVYWLMLYMGHDESRLKLLDGDTEDWKAAGLPVQSTPSVRPATTYTVQRIRSELLATNDYVKNADVQIVDSRTFDAFGQGAIPGALNIPYDMVTENGRLKNESVLESVFAGLTKDKPVVVYANTEFKASMVWFALKMMGYDARIYTWNDWLKNLPAFRMQLNSTLTRAEPNPATPGPVKIHAVFEVPEDANKTNRTDENLTTLSVMGCATCEPITVWAGSLTKSKNPGLSLGSSTQYFTCTAKIRDSEGNEVASVPMERVSDDEYVGTWDATGASPGSYHVSFVVTVYSLSKEFEDALTIVIQ
ncbi:MAG TPA: rhodanese-like domain-containing protein [Methanothrix sp.]|nr:rhodanese-like domain-containing protein [Methanothrix sp.]HOK58391.1 rhodanese-like domain-containing protein [Methanothrix sp.]HOL43629.1 rhodanese-like domain-containing protein [Methanothrix sp.]HPO88697.1 rhodanese-like domain-containing protein [Methanothrix sp.]